MNHGDPKNPKKNPHPVKRYEVIATSEAPGPWDSVKGYLPLAITNVACVPQGSFTGGRNVPNHGVEFEITRIDEKTWKGYFYRDALQDEDYFGLGKCHWDSIGVTPIFTAHGNKFGALTWLDDAQKKGPQVSYFKKSDFLDGSQLSNGVQNYSSVRPEVTQHPDAFFKITVTVKVVEP